MATLCAAMLLVELPAARAAGRPENRGPARATIISPAERRAVRGSPLAEDVIVESPELRELRRFESEEVPRDEGSLFPDDPMPLPEGLRGPWSGSGDVPAPVHRQSLARPAQPPVPWLHGLAPTELPLRWEPHVVRFLTYFKESPDGRRSMAGLLRKMGRYRALMERVFEREGVPKDLIYVAMFESGFEPGATSSKSAAGLWQFMPSVGRAYGLEVSHWMDARRDPERATVAAARYLADLHERFGSWELAFAAYHAGYGNVLQSMARYNTNDYWELCRHEAGLPWETTLYVPRILAGAVVGHNRALFGFQDVVPDEPSPYAHVEVKPGTQLERMARAADIEPEVLQALNPELVRRRTPPGRDPVLVRVPAEMAGQFARSRMAAHRADTVILRFGESLHDVARARGVPVQELQRLNGVEPRSRVEPGTVIVVPPGSDVPRNTGGAVQTPAGPPDQILLAPVPAQDFQYADRRRVFYWTRHGDTLKAIANVLGVAPRDIVEWNHLDVAAKLPEKLMLQVFVHKDFDSAGIVLIDAARVQVVPLGSEEFLDRAAALRGKSRIDYAAKEGDTLVRVAKRYGVRPEDLARINQLSSRVKLAEGQRIVIYAPVSKSR
jgi:membrane-bound lytic murein transglycosylase D